MTGQTDGQTDGHRAATQTLLCAHTEYLFAGVNVDSAAGHGGVVEGRTDSEILQSVYTSKQGSHRLRTPPTVLPLGKLGLL